VLSLLEPPNEFHYDSLYTALTGDRDTVEVGFTRLPLITLTTPHSINRYEKKPARLS
jgi:hypothetical protein